MGPKPKVAVLLLVAWVFVHIVLYSDRLVRFADLNSSGLGGLSSNLIEWDDARRLSVTQQNLFDIGDEPVERSLFDASLDFPVGVKSHEADLTNQSTAEDQQSRLVFAGTNEIPQLDGGASESDKHSSEKRKVEAKSEKVALKVNMENDHELPHKVSLPENDGLAELVVLRDSSVNYASIKVGGRNAADQSKKMSSNGSTEVRCPGLEGKAINNHNCAPTDASDSTVRILRDQITRAKVFLSLGPSRAHTSVIRDLRVRLRDIQRVLGDATMDSQLPKDTPDKLRAMELTLLKGKQIQDGCSDEIKKLRETLRSTEEQLNANKKESNFLAQMAAKTIPKGLHCLPLRLMNEYYRTESGKTRFPHEERFEDPALYHYALFSDNVLAAAVVVNSTIANAKKPEEHVIHIVTDKLNYVAMKMWFLANPPAEAAIQVQNIEEFTWLNSSYSPVLKQLESQSMIEYYFQAHKAKRDENLKYRNPKYLSILNHLRFYLPEIFPKLPKVLFLDDDTVVQRDLTPLWSVDLKGNVNGAVETCGQSFHRFDKYLNFSNPLIAKNFNPRACGWAYGMNIFDLDEWRKQNVTDVYHHWQNLNENRLLWKLGTLPVGLVTFWRRTFALDRSWHLLGLGYNPEVNRRDIERGAVIHYNGNLKPWLEIGFPHYRNYWTKYVNYESRFLRECNINP